MVCFIRFSFIPSGSGAILPEKLPLFPQNIQSGTKRIEEKRTDGEKGKKKEKKIHLKLAICCMEPMIIYL